MSPLAYSGIIVAVAGPVLVQFLGISDACGGELAGRLAEFAPAAAGAVMAWVGHRRTSKALGAVRSQVEALGHAPHA